MFIMSLALADLTVGCIVMPISSAYALTGEWKNVQESKERSNGSIVLTF